MFHVIKSIEHDQRPHDRDHTGKEHGRSVQSEIDGEATRKAVDFHGLPGDKGQADPHQYGGEAYHRQGKGSAASFRLRMEPDQDKAAQNRRQHRRQQKQWIQSVILPTI